MVAIAAQQAAGRRARGHGDRTRGRGHRRGDGTAVLLDQRIDQQVKIAMSDSKRTLGPDGQLMSIPAEAGSCSVAVIDSAGNQLSHAGAVQTLPTPPVADLARYAAGGAPVTVTAGEDYRIQVATLPGGRFLLVSEATAWSDAVVYRLILIELAVTLTALALAVALAVGVSRFVLKPLDTMSATATRIADGELSHRVELAGAPTEVAVLGQSMNQMLGRIEHAFTQRQLAEDRLRRFVADAGHELRTPLTAIMGYAQLVRKGALTEPEQLDDAMRRVEDETHRMTSLVDELLLLARLDQGRPLDRVELDLAELVTAAVQNARAADPHRSLTLIVEPGAHPVVGDEHRLSQVLGNLLANVRAHTPAGTAAEVRVSRAGYDELVDVIDQGPGIAADQADKVFERFYRADLGRHRVAGSGEGSGLGLSIVAAIVAAHQGSATVVPHRGGAWLRVMIPQAAAAKFSADSEVTPMSFRG
ncbi:sensor histidine kinase [Kribbella albertanoniae]|uniref:histidine kinase n=1 Tax=Kribbella albertanoniae TaxID=1266829 RepID=A0A4R4PKZ5_9ACTN|nr:HAMP domain-containing sensor histidine kinase [Kribbella albertanoniae]TDC22648.1 HAMP domain-containing histidine kinase [Kribbella albertanoniae]